MACNQSLWSIWAVSSEKVPPSMRKMFRFSLSFACTKYHPGLWSPFLHSVVSNDSVNGMPWADCACAVWSGPSLSDMPEDTFSHGAANMIDDYKRSETSNHSLIMHRTFLSELGQTGLSKQCRSRSDAAERGVWSGSTLFALIQQF